MKGIELQIYITLQIAGDDFAQNMQVVPGLGAISNLKNGNLPECGGNNKASTSGLSLAFNAEIYHELFDTLVQWNDYLENHVPYFQDQTQGLGL